MSKQPIKNKLQIVSDNSDNLGASKLLRSVKGRADDRRSEQDEYSGGNKREDRRRENELYNSTEEPDKDDYKENYQRLQNEKAELVIPRKDLILYYGSMGASFLLIMTIYIFMTINLMK